MNDEDDYTISEEQRLGMLEVEKFLPMTEVRSEAVQEDSDDDDDDAYEYCMH